MAFLRSRYLDSQHRPRNNGVFSSIWPRLRPQLKNGLSESQWIVCDHSSLNAWVDN